MVRCVLSDFDATTWRQIPKGSLHWNLPHVLKIQTPTIFCERVWAVASVNLTRQSKDIPQAHTTDVNRVFIAGF